MQHKSRQEIMIVMELIAVVQSYLLAVGIRFVILLDRLGSDLNEGLNTRFLVCSNIFYLVYLLNQRFTSLEKLSSREIVMMMFN